MRVYHDFYLDRSQNTICISVFHNSARHTIVPFLLSRKKNDFPFARIFFFLFRNNTIINFFISLQFLFQAHFFFYSNIQFLFVSFSSFSIFKLSRYNYIFSFKSFQYLNEILKKAYWTFRQFKKYCYTLIFLKKITLFLPLAMKEMCITHAVLMNKWFDDAKLSRNVSENNFRGKQYDLR